MAQNSMLGSKFYLTARAGEQLPNSSKTETKDTLTSNIGDYVSTVEQDSVANKKQNDAITYSAVAGFTLYRSNTVRIFNAYIKKANRDQSVA